MCSEKNGVKNVLMNDFYQVRLYKLYGDRHLILYGG